MKGVPTRPLVLVAPGTERKGAEFYDYGVTVSNAYLRAVLGAGGLPWIMPCTTLPEVIAECVRRCQGVMLTGGDDINPKLYRRRCGAKLRATLSPHDNDRDMAELLLIREVFRQGKPLLAICRGHQMLNVAFGGELITDIPLEVKEALNHTRMEQKDRVVHLVDLAEGSLLRQLFGKATLGVNSTHHQAVRAAAPPFRVTARSADGVIEAMELGLSESHLLPYLLAVQFHPERLIPRNPEFMEIFRSFMRACCRVKAKSI